MTNIIKGFRNKTINRWRKIELDRLKYMVKNNLVKINPDTVSYTTMTIEYTPIKYIFRPVDSLGRDYGFTITNL